MPTIGLPLFWGALAVLYLVLAALSYRIYRKINRLQNTGSANFYISPEGITTGERKHEESIRVTGIFKSILLADSIGFFFALIGAILTAYTI